MRGKSVRGFVILLAVAASPALPLAQISETPDWTVSAFQSAFFGHAVDSAGDVNGDGYDDVIVGAHLWTNGTEEQDEDEGRAFVYLGGAGGIGGQAWSYEANSRTAYFGFSVAGAGDVNGDGYDDVIVGAPRYRLYNQGGYFGGGAFVFHGSASGPSLTPDWLIEETAGNVKFGQMVSPAGDVNGDGYDDVLVAAPWWDTGPEPEQENVGRVYLYLGSTDGLASDPAWTVEGDLAKAALGWSIAAAGDVNGDGYDDVIIGDDPNDGGAGGVSGRAWVYHGSPSGLGGSPAWVKVGADPFGRFGSAVGGAGDVNGDGYDDVIVGASSWGVNGARYGRAFVFLGSSGGLASDPIWTATDETAVAFGRTVDGAGDVNNDGFDDIILGAPVTNDGSGTGLGWAYLYLGAATGVRSSPAWDDKPASASNFGSDVASAGDVNSDGFSDILIGAEHAGGRVYAYYGEEGAGNEEFFVDFTWDPRRPEAQQGIQFSNLSSGENLVYSWDLDGDGIEDSSLANPSHAYAAPGPQKVTLTVRSDTTSERGSRTRTVPVGNTGVIVTGVTRTYEGFFLDGDIDNTFTVSVDWDDGPPGNVRFSVDGQPDSVELGDENGATHTFNIHDDFTPMTGPNVIRIKPQNGNGIMGPTHTEDIYVFAFPAWLKVLLAGTNLTLTTGMGEILFGANFDYPTPHLCKSNASYCNFDVPDFVPYIDGVWGLTETYASAEVEVSSKGRGTGTLLGKTGVSVADSSIKGSIEGSATVSLGPPRGYSFDHAAMKLSLKGKGKKDVGALEGIPILKTLLLLPGGKWLNEKGKVIIYFEPFMEYTTTFKEKNERLQFDESTTEVGLDLRAALKIEAIKDRLEVEVWVGGGGSFTVGVPEPTLRSAKIAFQAGAEYKVDLFFLIEEGKARCEAEVTWSPAGGVDPEIKGCTISSETKSAREGNPAGSVSLNKIDYLPFGAYSVLMSEPMATPARSTIPGSVSQTTVVGNIFPGASPVLAETASGKLLVWEHQDPGMPVTQSTDIAWSFDDGTGWSPIDVVVDDTRAELSPVAAADSDGQVVAAWLRIKDPFFNTPITTTADLPLFYKELEVVSAVFDPVAQTWSTPVELTSDTALDTNLELLSDGAGNLMLLWLSNPDGEFISTATSPSSLMYSTWDTVAGSWSTPAVAASGLVGVVEAAGAFKGTGAFAILTRDPNPAVEGDTALDLVSWNGTTWTAPAAFATTGLDNRNPAVIYDPAGEGNIVWLQDDDLVHATLTVPAPQVVRAGSDPFAFAGAQLLVDPSGHLTLLWQQVPGNQTANLFLTVYDASAQEWSLDRRLTDEDEVQQFDAQGFFGTDGKLHATYLATKVERTSEIVDIEGTPVTIDNIPQGLRTDLRVLEHTLGRDLAVTDEDLEVDPHYPVAGEAVSAVLTVHNAGDFAAGSFDVELFVGDPAGGGTLVGSDTIIGSFRAGDVTEIPFAFVHPGSAGNLIAVVDGGDLVAEADEQNNRATHYLENANPEARIKADLASGPPPLTVQLDAYDSFDPDNDPITVGWSFGDGTAGESGGQVSHTFDAPGNYAVGISVADDKGGVGTASLPITVTGGAGRLPDGVILGGTQLSADLEANQDLTLNWGSAAACGLGASDYAVYEGSLGDFTSHAPVICGTSGTTSHTFTPAAGDTYYLVAPTNASWEGSYGLTGYGAERPSSTTACLPRGIGSCVTCGNGVIDPGEVCEPGDLGGATCGSLGYDTGTLACGPTCQAMDSSGCYETGCGNGMVESGETCDALDLGGESCATQGFDTGSLACNGGCDGFDTAGCFVCGNGICETYGGEDCLSCPADCNGVQGGNPSSRYCCGDGDGENPIYCEDAQCNTSGNTCTVEPALVTTGLVLHLESDRGLAADESGTVVRWSDLSGQGNYVVPGGDPMVLAGAVGGNDAIRFDGVDDKLERTSGLSGLPAGNADRTAFLVVRYAGFGFGGFAYGTRACDQVFGLVVNPTGELAVQGWCVDLHSTAAGTGQGWLVQSAILDTDLLTHYLDGAVIDQQTHGFNTVLGELVIGAEMDSDPYVEMDAAAVLVYDRALSELERLQVEAYFQQKYLGTVP